jgi:hypothetical protein
VNRIFNRIAAWRIDDADAVSRVVNAVTASWFLSKAWSRPRTVSAATLD